VSVSQGAADLSPAALQSGAGQLGVALESGPTSQLLQLAAELIRWNQDYNLTAIDAPGDVLTKHLLDSLSANVELTGARIADVGTGAGFPGLPLAIVNPGRQFLLIDSVAKKLRFVDHIVQLLGLANVRTLHSRVEQAGAAGRAHGEFDTVIARAFAPLPRLVQFIAPLAGRSARIVAMKGRWPPAPGADDGGKLPAPWRIESVRRVQIPGLAAERHLLRLTTAIDSAQ